MLPQIVLNFFNKIKYLRPTSQYVFVIHLYDQHVLFFLIQYNRNEIKPDDTPVHHFVILKQTYIYNQLAIRMSLEFV